MSHRPQKPRHLAPMVRPVIHYVQHDLPHRFREGIAVHVFKSNRFRQVGITEIAHPQLPVLMEGGPFGLQHGEIAILGIDEGRPWFGSHSRQPNAIRGIDMHQGAEDALL